MSGRIRVLPAEIANRIAAGEVVERPASVVKELIENALDAGAQRIELALEEGGIRMVRVSDDGEGMAREDLERCILPHATSKISDVDDLFRVASFGFRGEALPSIAAVSDFSILSREAEATEAFELRTRGGEEVVIKPAAGRKGTVVQVRDLFFNVPARRHFLKQARTELAHCLEAVTRVALPEPALAIQVTHEGKRSLDLPAGSDRGERIAALYGPKLGQDLKRVSGVDGAMRLEAWIGPPSLVRATARHQVLYLNGRWIRDRSLLHAFRDAYRGMIMPKEHPVGFLFLEVDPATVDVNVHPTKSEVRFRERDRVFSFIRRVVHQALLADREDPGVRVKPAEEARSATRDQAIVEPAPVEDQTRLFDREWHKGGEDSNRSATEGEALRERPLSPSSKPRRGRKATRCHELTPKAERDLPRGAEARVMQVHRSYLVVETSAGLRIVDQHALHERKIFEELKARFAGAPGEDQRLLVPDVLELSAPDQALVLEHEEELKRVGFEVAAFGGTSVAVHAMPAIVAHLSGAKLLEPIIETLRDEGSSGETPDVILRTLGNLACRAAATFNQTLEPSEIAALLEWAESNPEARNCPHGRPVALQLSLEELELQFARKK